MTPAISVTGLTRRYWDQIALDDVSFTVPGRKITGLLGRKGAVKPITELRHSLLSRQANQANCRSPGGRSSSRKRPPSWAGPTPSRDPHQLIRRLVCAYLIVVPARLRSRH